jgi:hypothetical protein
MQTSACSHILIELADDVTTYFQRVVRQSAHGLAENDRRRVRLCPEHPWAIATEHIRAIICVFSILFNLYTRMLYCLLKAEVEASQKKTSCVRNHHGFLCPRAEPRAVYDDAKIDEMLRNHHFGMTEIERVGGHKKLNGLTVYVFLIKNCIKHGWYVYLSRGLIIITLT